MDSFDTIDEKWEYWRSLVLSVVDDHAPFVKVRVRQDSLPWITEEVRRVMRARNYFRKKFRKTKDPTEWEHFRKLCNLVKRQLKDAIVDHFEGVCRDATGQPWQMWKEIDRVLGRKQRRGISVIRTSQGELSDSQHIAEEMSSYFFSCVGSSNPVKGVGKDPKIPPVNSRFEFTEIDKETVLRHLTNLNERKATGADGTPAKLLRMATPGIATSLTKLFNYSLKTGLIPRDWKAAHVTPVPKVTKSWLRTIDQCQSSLKSLRP